MCKLKKIGWCNDGPGEVVERLEHVLVPFVDDARCIVTFEGETKEVSLTQGSAVHYFGR